MTTVCQKGFGLVAHLGSQHQHPMTTEYTGGHRRVPQLKAAQLKGAQQGAQQGASLNRDHPAEGSYLEADRRYPVPRAIAVVCHFGLPDHRPALCMVNRIRQWSLELDCMGHLEVRRVLQGLHRGIRRYLGIVLGTHLEAMIVRIAPRTDHRIRSFHPEQQPGRLPFDSELFDQVNFDQRRPLQIDRPQRRI